MIRRLLSGFAFGFVAVLGTLGISQSASAITYTLNNINLSGGGTGTGQFDFNAGSYSNINITFSNGSFGSYTFTDSDSRTSALNFIDICQGSCGGGSTYFRLTFDSNLSDLGGTFSVLPGPSSFYGSGASSVAVLSGGQVSADAVPFEFSPGLGLVILGVGYGLQKGWKRWCLGSDKLS